MKAGTSSSIAWAASLYVVSTSFFLSPTRGLTTLEILTAEQPIVNTTNTAPLHNTGGIDLVTNDEEQLQAWNNSSSSVIAGEGWNSTNSSSAMVGDDDNGSGDDDDEWDDDSWDDDDGFHGTKAETVQSILPKIAAVLSILGSTCIIAEVWGEHQKTGRPKASNRLLVSLSVSDVIFSLAWFWGTWAAPSDTEHLWNPKGTTATCSLQGLMIELAWAATPLFNLSLCWYVLLQVRYTWREVQLQAMDPFVHGGIWGLALLMATLPLFFGMYNNSWAVCWIDKIPYDCEETYKYGETTCERGDNASLWGYIYTAFPGWICIILCVVFMGMLYWTVRQIESKMMRNTITAASSTMEPASNRSSMGSKASTTTTTTTTVRLNTTNRNKSTMVAVQGILYVAVFLIVYLPHNIAEFFYFQDKWWTELDTFAYTILPLQGFLNFFVFLRKRERMHSAYGRILHKIFCCCGIFTTENVRQSFQRTKASTTTPSARNLLVVKSLPSEESAISQSLPQIQESNAEMEESIYDNNNTKVEMDKAKCCR